MTEDTEWDLTVTWHIQDYSYSHDQMKIGEELKSPVFIFEPDNSRWYLSIYPAGWRKDDKKFFRCFLNKKKRNKPHDYGTITFEFQVRVPHERVLATYKHSCVILNGFYEKLPNLIKERKVFNAVCECESDTLSIRCSMKKHDSSKTLSLKKELRTNIFTHKSLFEWRVVIYLHPKLEFRGYSYFSLGINFFQVQVTIEHEHLVVWVKKMNGDAAKNIVAGKIQVLDVKRCFVCGKEDIFHFDSIRRKMSFKFPPLIKVQQLIDNMDEFFINRVLLLRVGFFQYKSKNPLDMTKDNFRIFENFSTLSDDLRGLLVDGTNFDVKLLAKDGVVVQAHRFVLRARSPVFRAMLDQENRTGVIKVEDMDSNTLKYLVEFLYTAAVEDMKCGMDSESVSKLLLVADKYEAPALKEMCVYLLIRAFKLDNMCGILNLAIRVRHELLKNVSMLNIYYNETKIPNFSEWVKENPELYSEIQLFSKHYSKK